MPLIDKVNDYDIVYKWFDYLKAQGHFINAVVPIAIGMPNHVHAVISFIEMQSKESVRRTTKNMKYGNCLLIGSIVAVINLYNRKWITFLPVRSGGHSNPCKGKWNLCASPEHYKHSFVKYYLKEAQGFYKIDNVGEMSDKVFVQSVDTIMIDATSGKCPDFAEK